jgi:hypothetical protein
VFDVFVFVEWQHRFESEARSKTRLGHDVVGALGQRGDDGEVSMRTPPPSADN